MRFYDNMIISLSTILIKLLRSLKTGGTSLPGKLALKFDKEILIKLSRNKKILVVTGTNGKTTTSRMIAQILKMNKKSFYTNKSGANLLSGITTAFIENYKQKTDYVLLEIDEAAFSIATKYFSPTAVVVTNFFRDQLDRYGELYSTLNKVKEGVKNAPKTILLLNADDSLCASIGNEYPNPRLYYGFSDNVSGLKKNDELSDSIYCIYCKTRYKYESKTIGHLGHFRCDNCKYERPDPDIFVHDILKRSSDNTIVSIEIDKTLHKVEIRLPAIYNIYNALSALSLAKALHLDTQNSIKALATFEGGFGRMEKIDANGKFINIMLVKNPAGFNSSLEHLLSINLSFSVCFSINDNIADGRDISWLWDVNFEKLDPALRKNIRYIICSGKRANDMALRLKYMDVPEEKINVIEDYNEMLKFGLVNTDKDSTFYILPTYTSMLDIRKILQNKYNLKEIWK